jgi:hypothetical protein
LEESRPQPTDRTGDPQRRSAFAALSRNETTAHLGMVRSGNCVYLSVEIPDDVAQRLAALGGDLSRRALEAFAIEEYKLGHLSHPDLRRLLGLHTHYELDGFLKAHGVFEPYTLDDLERERRDLQQLGF